MLMSDFFGKSLIDDFFDDFAFPRSAELQRPQGSRPPQPPMFPAHPMCTDVRETSEGYVLDIELPGVRKEDITAELKDGFLTVSAVTNSSSEQKAEDGTYLRRERRFGTFRRSFYLGDQIKEEEIKAKFENGILQLSVPKKNAAPAVDSRKLIAIED